MQPTYSPSKVKKIRMCGFFARKATKGGRGVLAARRRKGRRKLCA
ncbi:MAG: 50S ribosomal protein L34 [bacterium]